MLNLIVKPKDSINAPIKHPGTGALLGTLVIAGPDHPATVARKREIQDAAQLPGYKPDYTKELRDTLTARTLGWSGVTDETGTEMPFSSALLADVYAQEWACSQVLEVVRGNEVFFQP